MRERAARLIIDLGNSQTRYAVVDETIPDKPEFFSMSNSYAQVTQADIDDMTDDIGENTTVLNIAGDLWANGALVENAHRMTSVRPTGLEKKYESAISRVTISLALYKATGIIARHFSEDIDKIQIQWRLVILMPPNDVKQAKGLVDDLKATTEVDVAYPAYHIDLEILGVRILAEGLAAYIGCMYVNSKSIRKGYAQYMKGSVLIVDIGAGTTDLCIIDNGHLVGNSKETISVGGTKIQTKLNQYFSSNSAIGRLDAGTVRAAAETGSLTLGAREIDVSEQLQGIKEEVAEELSRDIVDYFESISFPLNSLSYILVVGGGSIANDNVKSIGEMLLTQITKFARYTESMPVPEGVSPRQVNLLGGVVYSENFK